MNWTGFFEQLLHDPKEPLLFHTGFFLFIFSIFLAAYSFVYKKNEWRNLVIIAFGFYFYYKASGVFLLLLILTISADYLFSMAMERQASQAARKTILIISILFSLSFLLFFKYTNFFLENVGFLSGREFKPLDLILPIGISFYTFQSISYLVDIYTRKITRPSYSDYLMYMSFFPHLVAGPIVRARDFLPQLQQQVSLPKAHLNEAFFLITKGLVKKAIIADYVAQYSDAVFAQPDGFSGTENLIGSLCYTLQIFCDFSGYTDMAIGVALLLGFRLCLNFDSPYKALNITDFWRRWHISLSSWLRDYIYIPMGGNRRGLPPQLLYLLLTMLIGGFWHGPSWKFVFWGGAHGMLLIIHKLFTKFVVPVFSAKRPQPADEFSKGFTQPQIAGFSFRMVLNPLFWFLTFASVSLLWIPFRAESMEVAWQMYGRIFSGFDMSIVKYAADINPLLFILLIFGFFATLQHAWVKEQFRFIYDRTPFILKMVLLAVLIQTILQIRSESVQPFIYFQF
jgi:alginate O-acetyltransferase complex protein AlgI